MQIPQSLVDKILSKSAAVMAKSSGPVAQKQAFYKALDDAIAEVAFDRGEDKVQMYAKLMDDNRVAEAVRNVELKLDENHRLAVAAGSDGRS